MEFGHGFQNVVRQRVGIREALVQPVGGDQRGVERFHAVRDLRPLRIIRRGFRLRRFRGNGLRGFRRNGLGGFRGNGHRGFAVHVLAGQDGRIGLLVDVAVGAVALPHGGQLVGNVRVIGVLEFGHGFQNVVRQRVGIREALVQPVGGDQRGVERFHAVRILRPLRIIRRGFRLRRIGRSRRGGIRRSGRRGIRRSRRRGVRRSRRRGVRRSGRGGIRRSRRRGIRRSGCGGVRRSHARRRRHGGRRGRIDVHEVLQQDIAGLAELVAHASPRAVRRQHRQLRALLRRAQQRGIRGRSLEHLRAVRRYLHGYAAAQIPERVGRGGRLRGGRGGGGRVTLEQRALRRFVGGAGCLDAGALLERGHGLLRLAAVHTVGVAGLVAQPDQPRLQLAHTLVAVAGHEGHIAVVVGRVVVKERLLHGHGGDAVCVEAVLPLEVPHAARHLRGVFIALGGAGQVVQLHQPANKFGDAFAAVAASKFYVAEVLGGALRKERPQRFLIGLTGLVQTLLLLEGGDSLLRALAVYAVGGACVVAQRLQFGLHAAHARAAVSALQRQIRIIGGNFAREQHALQLGGRHAGHGHAQIALQLLDGNLRLLAEDAVGGVVQIAQLDQLFLQVLHVRVAVSAPEIFVHGGRRGRRGRRRVGRSGRGRGRRAVGGADVHVVVVPRVLHGAALLQAVVNHKLFAGGGEQRLVLRHVGVGLLEQHIGRVLAGGRAHAIDGVIRVDHIEIFARGHELRHQLAQHAADHLVVAAGQVKARDFRHPAGAAQIVHRAVVGGKGAHVLRDGQREVVHRVQTQAELAGLGQDNFHAGSHRALGYGLLVRRKRHAAAQQLHIQEAAALARKHGAVDGHGQREHRFLAGAGHHVHLAEGRIPRQHMDALRVGAVHIIDVAAHLVQQRVSGDRRREQLRLAGRSGLHLLLAHFGAGLDRVGQKIDSHAIQSARRAVRVRRLIVGVSVMHAHDVVRAAGDQRIGVPRLKQRVILPAVYAVNAAAAGQSGSHCHGRRHERNRHQKAQPF